MQNQARLTNKEKVLTRICNTYLQPYNKKIEEGTLTTGSLDDGFLLRSLVSALSGNLEEVIGRLDEPKSRVHKINNLATSLQFLKNDNLLLVGIGPEDILDRNEKLILGLIWTIILKYHVGGSTLGDAQREITNFIGDLGIDYHFFSGNRVQILAEVVNAIIPGCFHVDMLFNHDANDINTIIKI
eukprot:TRINITY_DN10826_c0_g1_i1.p1 TRINITY_DN10826_c0_g1~~TRINITY_DN10826_c0_g1_i1.p1  ORF type:complete len:185 (+),score=13.13 TRINITY_DN10826_c0_g1_i1:359-913(+)